jgi:hypothetical protein
MATRICACGCGASLDGRRANAFYADGRCRVRAHRARKAVIRTAVSADTDVTVREAPTGLGAARVTGRDQMREAAERLVITSCQEQGIEAKVSDPVVIGKVAALLRSDVPDRCYAPRVEAVEPAAGRADRDVGDHRGQDRSPPRKRQAVPGVAQG